MEISLNEAKDEQVRFGSNWREIKRIQKTFIKME